MTTTLDAVVVGAGPYGLSVAAHLRGRGRTIAIFGRAFEMWRHHMPRGMLLRSHWWATNLSDPKGAYGFDRFFRESGLSRTYPLPIQTFIDYGQWFRERAVPEVDETFVSSIAREGKVFRVALADGRQVTSRAVVMAVGLLYYAHCPAPYDALPPDRVSHSSGHGDYGPFRGHDVVVIGGGQSAIEFAALLHEVGARVQVVARHRVPFWGPDRGKDRPLLERLKQPDASIAAGWQNWALDRWPYLFHRFPQTWKDAYNSNYVSGASDWLKTRFIGKVPLHEGQTVTQAAITNGKVALTLSGGNVLSVDHVMFATGYRVDVGRLSMLAPELCAEIRSDQSIPYLDPRFQCSVPGLYFVGVTAVRSFGPLFRFVAGVGAAARRVAGAVAAG